jgi:hypothetical protein
MSVQCSGVQCSTVQCMSVQCMSVQCMRVQCMRVYGVYACVPAPAESPKAFLGKTRLKETATAGVVGLDH